MSNKNKKSFKLRTIDYILYFFIFGGNTLMSGSLVHALEFSLNNIAMFFIGLILTTTGTYMHQYIFSDKEKRQKVSLSNQSVTILIAVSSGSIAGGILHWQQGPKFALFIIISGFILSLITTLLYTMKPIKDILISFFVKTGMFAGMSFISGSIVHSINIWFTNYLLILIGIVLAVGCSLINESLYKKRTINYFLKESLILLFLTMGIGGITGGILHFEVNSSFALMLLTVGIIVSFTSAMFKREGSLVELRR